MSEKTGAFGGRSVAGANRDCWFVVRVSEALSGLCNADERSAEVALDVDGEGFDWRYINDAATRFVARFRGGRLFGGEHQAVDAPEKSGESFAGASGGEDQRGITARDRGPTEDLRARRTGEHGGEPIANGWVKKIECI